MTGIEKVTGKIIADAKADAEAILDKAEETCAAVRAEYEARTKAEQDKLEDHANRECEALITRAKSSAAMAKRNVMLESRAALMAEAYATAEKEIKGLPTEECSRVRFSGNWKASGRAWSFTGRTSSPKSTRCFSTAMTVKCSASA